MQKRFNRAIICILLCTGPITANDKPDAEILFATRILPLLKSKCFACHGDDPAMLKGKLDLRSLDSTIKGGENGSAINVKKPQDSLLLRAVTRTDPDVSAMPPKENDKLTEMEMSVIRQWIESGAPWPKPDRIEQIVKSLQPAGIRVRTSGGLTPEWTNRTYQSENLWAYQPIARSKIDATGSAAIDHWIQKKLDSLKLTPALRADRRTLIRRVTFDLTGLPPTPKEIDHFLNDKDTDERAFAKVVDRLLDSPHFGEQMARHWLDVTRYADSAGFANDYERGNAWRYRDYVVRSFNKDKPFNQFVREQIAGDEIDSKNPELIIATGFLRMGAWELTGMEVARVARQRFLDDVTDTVCQVFLGHMAQCARCHDHKFDPVPTRDYYGIQAVFMTTQIAERPAAFLPEENRNGFADKKYLEARRLFYQGELNRISKIEAAAKARWEKENPDKKGFKFPRHEALSAADLGMERIARKGLERLRWEEDRFEPFAHAIYNGKTPEVKAILAPFRMPKDPLQGTFDSAFILAGGDPFSPKESVNPGVLSAAGIARLTDKPEGRRKEFAEWIVDPGNPLTARVYVNRLWQWIMGNPIAGNPNNFGATGKKPTHPELLDWLASELVERKWSTKQIIRTIVLSRTYARSSQHPDPKSVLNKDPDRQSYSVFNPRRLTAEELRDAILFSSGELNPEIGGVPVRHEINEDVARQPRQVMGTFANIWEPSPKPEQRNRRSLYTLKLRGLRDPLAEVFNQPSPEFSCECRDRSTITPQAFALFNSHSIRTRALAFADSAHRQSKSRDDTIRAIYLRAIGRSPSDTELSACLKHWEKMTKRHETFTIDRPVRLTEITREAVEENVGQKYSYVEKLFAAADYVPDLHPADATPEIRGLMEVCLVIFNTNEFIMLD